MNILFVCAGNNCRSPMAAEFLNMLARKGGSTIIADSAGIGAYGFEASENAVMAAKMWHADISAYRPKRLTRQMIDRADLVLTMDRRHVTNVLDLQGPGAPMKAYSLLGYVGESGDVADPYGKDFEAYEECAKALWEAAERLFDRLTAPGLSIA